MFSSMLLFLTFQSVLMSSRFVNWFIYIAATGFSYRSGLDFGHLKSCVGLPPPPIPWRLLFSPPPRTEAQCDLGEGCKSHRCDIYRKRQVILVKGTGNS